MHIRDDLFSHVSGRHLALRPLVNFYEKVPQLRKMLENRVVIPENLTPVVSSAFGFLYEALDIHHLGHLKMHYNIKAFYDNYGVAIFQAHVRGQKKFDRYSLAEYERPEDEIWRQYLDDPWTNPIAPEYKYLPIKLIYENDTLEEVKPDVWDSYELDAVRAWRVRLRQIGH